MLNGAGPIWSLPAWNATVPRRLCGRPSQRCMNEARKCNTAPSAPNCANVMVSEPVLVLQPDKLPKTSKPAVPAVSKRLVRKVPGSRAWPALPARPTAGLPDRSRANARTPFEGAPRTSTSAVLAGKANDCPFVTHSPGSPASVTAVRPLGASPSVKRYVRPPAQALAGRVTLVDGTLTPC